MNGDGSDVMNGNGSDVMNGDGSDVVNGDGSDVMNGDGSDVGKRSKSILLLASIFKRKRIDKNAKCQNTTTIV